MIPFAEFWGEDHLPGKPLLVGFINRSFDVIGFRVNVNMYLQSRHRDGRRGSVCGICVGYQRRVIPTAGDLREESVLDGIELGTI